MPKHDDEPWVQLTTRIPKILHRELKLRCVETETALMQFVARALRERLDHVGTHRARRVG